MGFLSRLVDKLLHRTANGDKPVGRAADKVAPERVCAPPEDCAKNEEEFFRFVDTNYAQFIVRKELPVEYINSSVEDMPLRPVDRCLYAGEVPLAAIYYTPHNGDRSSAYLEAKAAIEAVGVPVVNFFEHMPNEYEYIAARIDAAVQTRLH